MSRKTLIDRMDINKTYRIKIGIKDQELTYTGTILANSNGFVTFRDKFNKIFSYNLNNIISFEELSEVIENGTS